MLEGIGGNLRVLARVWRVREERVERCYAAFGALMDGICCALERIEVGRGGGEWWEAVGTAWLWRELEGTGARLARA